MVFVPSGASEVPRNGVTHLFIYRLRSYGDLEGIVEELSAINDKQKDIVTNIP